MIARKRARETGRKAANTVCVTEQVTPVGIGGSTLLGSRGHRAGLTSELSPGRKDAGVFIHQLFSLSAEDCSRAGYLLHCRLALHTGRQKAHLTCFSSLGDQCPVLPLLPCLKTIVLQFCLVFSCLKKEANSGPCCSIMAISGSPTFSRTVCSQVPFDRQHGGTE